MKRLTKRQRKARRGNNAAVRYSLANGDVYESAGTIYIGEPPKYQLIGGSYMKATKGVPYVRSSLK